MKLIYKSLFISLIHNFLTFDVSAKDSFACNRSSIDILVSPMISRNLIRELELIWDVRDPQYRNDWVALYNKDPKTDATVEPLFRSDVRDRNYYIKTNVQERHDFESLSFENVCLGYWAVYWRRNNNSNSSEMIADSCLQTFPTWMEKSRSRIGRTRLKDLFIPGTHDSSAYIIAHHPFKETVYQMYVYTQDEDILTQLKMGARYLDLRVGLYEGVYWTNHGQVALQLLTDVLDQVKIFISNTNEVVVIDFHRFPVGFKNDSDYINLANYVNKRLDGYIANNVIGWHATLEDIWQNSRGGKQRIVVSFNHGLIVRQFKQSIHPQIWQAWADTHHPDKLFTYIGEQIFEKKPDYMFASMMELTPNTWSFVKYRKGLREMSQAINKDVTRLFSGDWGRSCNVVAVDFLRSTGIVQSAIKWNNCR